MTFEEILEQAIAMLQRRGRLTYGALKLKFNMDYTFLKDLTEELIYGQQLVVDEASKVLVWTGGADRTSAPVPPVAFAPAAASQRAPLSYTPLYLTEKIRDARPRLEGERKQVTVLFADIKDSTELIRDLDPEAAQQLLDPLPPASAEAFLQALLGDDPSLAPLTQLLIMRTEGNPFFLEESVRTLIETGVLVGEPGAYRLVQPVDSPQVPATVQAVLAARIDRLPSEEKRLLQTAAVIGTEVPLPLLEAIAELPEAVLQHGLAHLQAAEFLYETRLFPEREYTFKHALTHEVAYGSLLQERRRLLHASISVRSTGPRAPIVGRSTATRRPWRPSRGRGAASASVRLPCPPCAPVPSSPCAMPSWGHSPRVAPSGTKGCGLPRRLLTPAA
jgi:class 3 adenylate cyclase